MESPPLSNHTHHVIECEAVPWCCIWCCSSTCKEARVAALVSDRAARLPAAAAAFRWKLNVACNKKKSDNFLSSNLHESSALSLSNWKTKNWTLFISNSVNRLCKCCQLWINVPKHWLCSSCFNYKCITSYNKSYFSRWRYHPQRLGTVAASLHRVLAYLFYCCPGADDDVLPTVPRDKAETLQGIMSTIEKLHSANKERKGKKNLTVKRKWKLFHDKISGWPDLRWAF